MYETVVPYEQRLTFYKWRNAEKFRELRRKVNPSPKGDFSLKPFDEHQAIFIHITKTAGTSVAKSLFGYLPYHYTAIQYRVFYGRETFKDYFKFAFVRNPWDRLYSAYRYLKAGGWNEEDKAWGKRHLSHYDDFNDFVLDWLTLDNIKKHIHFKPQYEFICDRNDNLLIDYLAYFETLNEDFGKIAAHLNISTSLESHNKNPGNSYMDVYSDHAKSRVAEIYAKDIALFGYSFDAIEARRVINQI
jgi:hypothetical protein